jgi:regulator of replication initiation timing
VDVDLWLYSRDRTQASQLRFYEAQAHSSGAEYVAFQAPNTLTTSTTYTLPASLTPTSTVEAGILQTDASGNLSWVTPAALAAATAWLLTGNSGTNPAVNFLGTTDAQPLVIRVDNQETFRFNPPGSSAPAWSIQRGGGNPRGLHAVDLQSERSAATQVASGNYSVIGGGQNNTASGGAATVSGGLANTASATFATISGGWGNTASGLSATVCGGRSNTASGLYATVGGGQQDTASGNFATVSGGLANTASGPYATVGGGWLNRASDSAATVSGGRNNTASGPYATVSGGLANTASGRFATVGGGWNNTASGDSATVGGGWFNTASGGSATVGGGYINTADGWEATVGGGHENTASSLHGTIGGGAFNRITPSGINGTIGGGEYNIVSGWAATVCGGHSNTASGDFSVVPGGYNSTANANFNLVFGEDVDPSVTETHRVYFFSPTNSGFLVINRLDGDHPIHVGTNAGNGNGAHLTAAGVWTNASSRSFKERFVQYRPAEVLERIRQLPVEGYFYKGTEEYHITPMAEDFYRLFGTGAREIIETDSTGQLVRRPNPDVDKYLAASDVAGVALLGVKALDELISTLDPQSSALAQRLEALEQENQQIKQENQQIKQENRQIKEENQQIKQENQRLRQQLEQVMERLALVEAQLQRGGSTAGENAWLGQNIPNPFAGTTTIPYYVPAGVSRAELVVRDVGGRELKWLELAERGAHGQVVLEMGLLGSGTYEYALVLDGRTVASRQMLLLK